MSLPAYAVHAAAKTSSQYNIYAVTTNGTNSPLKFISSIDSRITNMAVQPSGNSLQYAALTESGRLYCIYNGYASDVTPAGETFKTVGATGTFVGNTHYWYFQTYGGACNLIQGDTADPNVRKVLTARKLGGAYTVQLTVDGNVLSQGKTIFDSSQFGKATDISVSAHDNTTSGLYALANGKMYVLDVTGSSKPRQVSTTPMPEEFADSYTTVAVDEYGVAWLGSSDGSIGSLALSGYAAPGKNSVTASATQFIDGDSRLITGKSGLPVVGRRFDAVFQTDENGPTFAVEDASFKHSEATSVTTMPQSGDPAAAWWQSAPYVVAVLTVVGAVVVVGLSRRRSTV